MDTNYTNQGESDAPTQSADNFDAPMMPLGVSEFDATSPDDLAFAGEEKKKISSGTLLLIGVIVLAAAGLYSMRSLAIAMATSKGENPFDSIIASFFEEGINSGEAGSPAGASLVDDRTEQQVPLTDVYRNPFVSFLPPLETSVDTNQTTQQDDPEAVRERLRKQARTRFETAADGLRLVMVLGGSKPMANISGRIVHIGDEVYDEKAEFTFKVDDIDAGFVIISAEDKELDLRHQMVLRLSDD